MCCSYWSGNGPGPLYQVRETKAFCRNFQEHGSLFGSCYAGGIQTEGTSGRWAHFLEALLEKQSQSTSAELLGPAMNLKATNTPLLFFHLSSFFPVMHTYKQPFLALDGLSLVTHLQ